MTDSRTRNLTLAATLATLGVLISAASCTGPAEKTSDSSSKTTGPALAKGDKTTAMPGATGPTAAKASPKPGAKRDGPVVPPKPGAPLPPPVSPRGTKPTAAKPAPKPAPRPTATKPAPKPAPRPTATKPPKPAPRPTAAKPPKPSPKAAPKPTVAKRPKPAPKPTAGKRPKPAPKPTAAKPTTPKRAVASAQTEADRLLKMRLKELELERQKNAILVADYLSHARRSAKDFDHQATAEWSSKALELDHDNGEAEGLLRTARSAMGHRDAEIASLSTLLTQSKTVKREQAQFQANRYMDAARKAKANEDYEGAEQSLELAMAIIQNDPTGINWAPLDSDVKSELAAVRKLKAASDKTARARAAREAYRAVKEEEARRRLADVEKRNTLFEAAMEAFENEQYARAETLLQDYIELVPGDRNAQQLISTARRAKHERASEDSLRTQRERFREWRLDMRETTVPYHDILNWPSQDHWDRITELRANAGIIDAPEPDSPETAATRNKLRGERVSFQFQGAEFTEVIGYIADTRQLNVVIDPQVAPDLEAVPITLTLSDVTVDDALNTLNRIAGGLTYVVRGSVVFITRPEFAREEPIVQVHSVGDLTVALTNFIAPNLQLLPAGAEEDEENPRFGLASEGVASFGGAEDLISLVQNNVANPDYWTEEGVSIAASGEDKLVVVAEPNAQREVAAFLDDLRAFAGLVVTIETRFLTVTDNFLRDVGIDIRGTGGLSPGTLVALDDVTNGLSNNASAGFDNSGIGLPANASGKPSAGAFFNNGSDGDYRARTENIFDQALGTNITNVGGAAIQYTFVGDTNVALIMRAVEKSQEGRVLQAPSVTVFNTQRANITLINQLTFIQDGLVLDVQPTVSHDRKYITLQLRPTIANLVRPIPTFTTSLGAFTTPVTIQIPELQVQRAATTVRVPDGGTLLLGGLKNISQQDLKSETPWVSSIPFAAFFFGRKGSSEELSNLMVIVKATITDLSEQEARLRR